MRARLGWLGAAGAVVYSTALLMQCTSRTRDCMESDIRSAGALCTAELDGAVGDADSGEAGPKDASAPDVVAPPGCDLGKSPKESMPCVDDSAGVFVSPSGDDGAAGTKAAPARTVGKGIALAVSRGVPRVYVCEGTYDGPVEIGAAVSLYGGLSARGPIRARSRGSHLRRAPRSGWRR